MNLSKALIVGLLSILILSFFLKKEEGAQKAPRSIKQVSTVYTGPGSGHGFGLNVVYTIEYHTTYNNKDVVVISSTADGEDCVQIWSPISELVLLPDGSMFWLKAENSDTFNPIVVRRGFKS